MLTILGERLVSNVMSVMSEIRLISNVVCIG